MTNKLNISGITKEQLFNRVHRALEAVTKSPIVKRKNAVVNTAMVEILHGGHSVGQNEHNLDQFFNDSTKMKTTWEVIENIYCEDGDIPEGFCLHEGDTEEKALLSMKHSVISSLANDLSHMINLNDFTKSLSASNIYINNLEFSSEKDDDFVFEEMDEEQIEQFFENIEEENDTVVNIIFDYIYDIQEIKGNYETVERTIPQPTQIISDTKEIEVPKIYTTIIKYMSGDDSDDVFENGTTLNDVEVVNTFSEEEHDKFLIGLFRQHATEDEHDKYLFIENNLCEEMMSDLDMEEEELEAMTCDELLELMCKNIRPNQLIECIPSLSYNMVEVSVQYT